MDATNRRRIQDIHSAMGLFARAPNQHQRAKAAAKRRLAPVVETIVAGDPEESITRVRDVLEASNGTVRALLIDLLMNRLHRSETQVRGNAVLALAAFGWQSVAALLLRLQRTRSVQASVRYAESLGFIGCLLPSSMRRDLILRLDAIAADGQRHSEIRLACSQAILAIRHVSDAICQPRERDGRRGRIAIAMTNVNEDQA